MKLYSHRNATNKRNTIKYQKCKKNDDANNYGDADDAEKKIILTIKKHRKN